MKKGDLLVADIPFTDLTDRKLRPALVLVPENNDHDVLLAFVTTKMDKRDLTSIFISRTDLTGTGLKKESLIRINRLITLNMELVQGRIGCLPPSKILEMDQNLRKLFVL